MKRFFGSKQRKRDGRQDKHSLVDVAETRTDATRLHTQTKESGALSPRTRKAHSARLSRGGRGQPQQRQDGGARERPLSPRSPRRRRSITVPLEQPRTGSPTKRKCPPPQPHGNVKSSPPSILHKSTQLQFAMASASSSLTLDATPPKPVVRFLPTCESVASSVSGVHLMAGDRNSVASSSAMSSSEGNHQNVFDRVLHMVMAEENVRLNAMGMQGGRGGGADAGAVKSSATHALESRFSQVDAAARQALAAVPNSTSESSDDGLGHLVPPRREDSLPIDMDTGLELRPRDTAPIDTDTGMELGMNLLGSLSPIDTDTGLEIGGRGGGEGDDCEYHDLNDDGMDETQWDRLNAAAALGEVEGGLRGLDVADPRRRRSFEGARRGPLAPVPLGDDRYRASSHRSDPDGRRRGGTTAPPGPPHTSPPANPGGSGTQTNAFVESDGWVAFDDDQGTSYQGASGSRGAPGRVSDLAAF